MRRRLEQYRGYPLTWNLGSLLLDFFHLYGVTFNYVHTGISIRDGGSYFEKRKKEDGWFYPNR
jgi:non-canonical poly(A) RNA polymerase PAPD5/7